MGFDYQLTALGGHLTEEATESCLRTGVQVYFWLLE